MITKSRTDNIDRNGPIDWTEIHRRLEVVHERLSSEWTPTSEKVKEILRTRARILAREPNIEESDDESLEIVNFSLAYERYGVETTFVREVYPLRELTPLPGTPAFVLGIINVRGRMLCVVDLKKFFGLPEKGLTDLNKVIVLTSGLLPSQQTRFREGVGEVGVLADAILGVKRIRQGSIQPPVLTLTGVREQYLRGITEEHDIILDAQKLLSDQKLVISEEIDIVSRFP